MKEFSHDRSPTNPEELFNLRHASLRIKIENCFGIVKKRFRVLDAEPYWSFQTQVDVVLACCVIHNFIVGVDPLDSFIQELNSEEQSGYQNHRHRVHQSQREYQEENREWAIKRDEIAHAMWEDYRRNARNGM